MKVFLSKPDSLGDQFIAAGTVQAFCRLRPEVHLVWHVRSGMEVLAPAIGAEIFVPQIAMAPEAEAARLATMSAPVILVPYPLSPGEPWTNDIRRRVTWWAAFLRASRWDVSILGLVNRNWVGDLTVAVAPASRRIGFGANVTRQPLMNEAGAEAGPGAPAFTTELVPSFTRHESAQLRDLFAVVEPRLEPAPLWQPRKSWRPHLGTGPRRILIAPGVGADARRAWGTLNFSRVAEALTSDGATVSYVEGPGDGPYFDGAAGLARMRFGPDDLDRLADAMVNADLLICHDTAYVHIAAGVGVPTVAIYGAGQHGRFHPSGGRVKIVQGRIVCAGCQWHCLWDRLHCVTGIPVEAVTAAARQMLAGDSALVPVDIATPVADSDLGELAAVKRRLQEEVLALNADRWARLQIIQSLLASQQLPASRP